MDIPRPKGPRHLNTEHLHGFLHYRERDIGVLGYILHIWILGEHFGTRNYMGASGNTILLHARYTRMINCKV